MFRRDVKLAFYSPAYAPAVEPVIAAVDQNGIGVLLTRGIRGTYVYATDAGVRERLRRLSGASNAPAHEHHGLGS